MKRKTLLLATAFNLPGIAAFDGNEGGWKMDGDKIALADGNPVWLDADGTERTIQRDTIPRLNNENRTYRQQLQDAQNKLKDFDGLDAKQAREALAKLKDVDLTKMVGADKLEEVKTSLKGEYDAQLSERDKRILTMQSKLDGMVLDASFNGSEFIRDNIAIPVEMFRSHFGKYFKIEDEKIAAYDAAGNRLMSKKNIGEYADFNEAIELLVEGYSQRDSILKAPDQRGSGSQGGGGNRGGGKIIKRADFEQLPGHKQSEVAALIRKGEMQLVD